MKSILFYNILLFAIVTADSGEDLSEADLENAFQSYITSQGKVYSSPEAALIARERVVSIYKTIQKHNLNFAAGNSSYKLGLNEYSDRDPQECIDTMCRSFRPPTMRALPQVVQRSPDSFLPGPDFVDYTPYLQPVVGQGDCGSCWAFAAIAQVESLYKLYGYDYVLSPQMLVDCSTRNSGCHGGWPGRALDFILKDGITTADKYPYITNQTECQKVSEVPQILSKTVDYDLSEDEKAEEYLKNIIGEDGPVTVCITTVPEMFQYESGVFDSSDYPKDCSTNHAVLLVGYGRDEELKKDFWLVRNSWGKRWGEGGYIRIARNTGNNLNICCQIGYAS